ncbi:hypothetical protein HG535_0B03920 [Zygotorulaspora mrakii]|uniref:Carbohydrate kinase PfkB domain-containing protein n=1 Tax=Zygotorulaspora mrakii TaxID=42260 RepID=A0A7H9B0P1_ZYGMR|nr:uncharacterized protein HG535_0B03920 [Zygotorulaspora mrakii]QLG71352.1 hypothetical protein HG535_0B03920 [Zygotorulaspora mrakii]
MGAPLLTTNGMFIVDEIHIRDGSNYKDVPGGGGMFAMLGGCIACLDERLSLGLKWIIDCGYDFPLSLTETIQSWDTGAVFRHDTSRKTTKGWNYYRDNDFRDFKYLTPKKQIDVKDWCEVFGKDQLREMKCLHLLCSSTRCIDMIKQLERIQCRNETYVWEPIPDLCNQEYFNEIKQIVQKTNGPVIIFSPNAEEGARIFGDKEPLTLEACLKYIWKFDTFIGDKNICVLRCGKLGSISLGAKDSVTGRRSVLHLPAYHYETPNSVVDPTGGGNSFLGGFCVGYTITRDLYIANICANIAAGCVIEQIGIPTFDPIEKKWNGLTFEQRLEIYVKTNKLNYDTERICKLLENYAL